MMPTRTPQPFARPLGPVAAVGWVIAFVVVFVLALTIFSSVRGGTTVDDVSASLLEAASIVLVLYAIARVHAPEAPLRAILGARPIGFVPLLASAMMGGFAIVPLGELHVRVLARFPIPDARTTEITNALASMSHGQRVAGVVAISTIGPVVEELFFRGALATGVARSSGRFTAALAATASFALYYGAFEPRQLVIIGGLGILLAHARFATGSVLAPVAAHLAFRCADMAHDFRVFGTLDPLTTSARGWPTKLLVGGTIATVVLALVLPRLGAAGAAEEASDEAAPPPPRNERRSDPDDDRDDEDDR